MSKVLKGKRALITGGAVGIGHGIVSTFLEAGAKVVLGDIAGAEKAADQLGDGVVGIQADISRAEDVANLVTRATDHLGGLDVVVNNAGIEVMAPLHEQTEEQFDQVLAVNLRGTWLVYKNAADVLIKSKGSIINISSVAGLRAFAGLGPYGASKAGVIRMTEVIALEMQSHGVRANTICPGFIQTPMVGRFKNAFEATSNGLTFEDMITARQGRIGQPEDIGNAAVFLASDAANLINGTTIALDGGLSVNGL